MNIVVNPFHQLPDDLRVDEEAIMRALDLYFTREKGEISGSKAIDFEVLVNWSAKVMWAISRLTRALDQLVELGLLDRGDVQKYYPSPALIKRYLPFDKANN